MKKTKIELVFVTFPVMGHLGPTVELAKLLTQRHPQLSITVFMLHFPFEFLDKIIGDNSSDSVRFVRLPPVDVASSGRGHFLNPLVKANIPDVRAAVRDLILNRPHESVRLAGFVLDVGFTDMIDLADEFGVPSYIFFTPSAAFLRFILHFQFLHDHQGLNIDEFKDSDAELEVPSYVNSVPGKVFPSFVFDKEGGGLEWILHTCRRYSEVKGFIVNSFAELESHAIQSFSGCTPPVYAVGPIVNAQTGFGEADDAVRRWLDDQPPSSVVFLCFGSMGALGEDQILEIARALEQSGHRFLWSLRRPPGKGTRGAATTEYTVEEIEKLLPQGFLRRMARVGKVIGWAPQVAVLAHPAVGGFVSHCGWNSVMESVRSGVPIAAWPMFFDQQINAFQLVKDLGLAVEIKMDYDTDSDYIVSAHEIENGLKKLMDMNSEVRKKSKEMQKMSSKAVMDGGSSHIALGRLIEDLMANTQATGE